VALGCWSGFDEVDAGAAKASKKSDHRNQQVFSNHSIFSGMSVLLAAKGKRVNI
jgi:hypothetical protein